MVISLGVNFIIGPLRARNRTVVFSCYSVSCKSNSQSSQKIFGQRKISSSSLRSRNNNIKGHRAVPPDCSTQNEKKGRDEYIAKGDLCKLHTGRVQWSCLLILVSVTTKKYFCLLLFQQTLFSTIDFGWSNHCALKILVYYP